MSYKTSSTTCSIWNSLSATNKRFTNLMPAFSTGLYRSEKLVRQHALVINISLQIYNLVDECY